MGGINTEAAERGFDTHLLGMTSDGRVVRTTNGDRGECEMPESWSCGPAYADAIGFSVYTCGASENPVVLTPDAVYRTDDCYYVP